MISIFEPTTILAYALAKVLILSILSGAFIMAIERYLLSVLPDNRSGLRYKISVFSLLLFIFSLLLLFFALYEPYKIIGTSEGISSSRMFFWNSATDLNFSEVYNTQWYLLFLKIYFVGLVVLSLRLLLQLLKVKKYISESIELKGKYTEIIDALKLRLGIKRKIRILLSKRISTPTLYGLFRPVIIVPAGIFTHLSFDQLEAIMLHELTHIKRLDFLINLIQHITEILFFFNPFVWAVSSDIRREREIYCDDKVITLSGKPGIYAKALYTLSLFSIEHSKVSLAAAGDDQKLLLRRIHRLLNKQTMKTKRYSRVLLTSLLTLSLVIILTLSGFSAGIINFEKYNSQRSIETNSLIAPANADFSQISFTDQTTLDLAEIQDDTINERAIHDLDTLSIEEIVKYKQAIEFALQEIKSIDWETRQAELEEEMQKILDDMPERLEQERIRIQEQLSSIDQEHIQKQLEYSRQQLDSISRNIDVEIIQQDLLDAKLKMEVILRDEIIENEELREIIEAEFESLKNINIEDIMLDIDRSVQDINVDIDLDFDFDADLDIDSIMFEVQSSLNNIDIEEIKIEMDELLRELEIKLKEIEDNEN